MPKETVNHILWVSSNNESQVSSKIVNFLAVLHIKFYLKRLRVGQRSFHLQKSSIIALRRHFPYNAIFLRFGTIFIWCSLFGLTGLSGTNRYDYYKTFLLIDINLIIKYKQVVHMKFKVPWQLLSKFGSFFYHSLSVTY